jgi:2Fe-2S ferredoxin
MVRVTFITHDGNEHIIEAKSGVSLMEAARDNSVPGIEADCGGALSCGTCHVYVADDWVSRLPSMEDMEKDMLDFAWEPDSDTSRLSCQIKLSDSLNGLIVQIPANQG